MTRPRCNACEWFEMYDSSLLPEMSGKGRCWRNAWVTTIANIVDCEYYCNCWQPVPDIKQGPDYSSQAASTDTDPKGHNNNTTDAAQAHMHRGAEGGGPATGTGGRVGTSFSESLFGGDETLNLDLIVHIIHECSDNTKRIEGILHSCTNLLEVYCPEVATKQLQCNYCQDCCPYCRCCCPPLVQILDKMPKQDKIADSPAPEKETPIPSENFLKEDLENEALYVDDPSELVTLIWDCEKGLVGCQVEKECATCDARCDSVAQTDNDDEIGNKEE